MLRHPQDTYGQPPISRIQSNLFLGNLESAQNPLLLQEHKIGAILSLLNQPSSYWDSPKIRSIVPASRHHFHALSDLPSQNLLPHLDQLCDFIERMHAEGRNVLIHCRYGVSRAPAVMTAFLMRREKRGKAEMLQLIKMDRACVEPNGGFWEQLKVWEECEYVLMEEVWTEDGRRMVPKEKYREWMIRRGVVNEHTNVNVQSTR